MRTIIPAIGIVILLMLAGQSFINGRQPNPAREVQFGPFEAANPTLGAPATTQPTTQRLKRT